MAEPLTIQQAQDAYDKATSESALALAAYNDSYTPYKDAVYKKDTYIPEGFNSIIKRVKPKPGTTWFGALGGRDSHTWSDEPAYVGWSVEEGNPYYGDPAEHLRPMGLTFYNRTVDTSDIDRVPPDVIAKLKATYKKNASDSVLAYLRDQDLAYQAAVDRSEKLWDSLLKEAQTADPNYASLSAEVERTLAVVKAAEQADLAAKEALAKATKDLADAKAATAATPPVKTSTGAPAWVAPGYDPGAYAVVTSEPTNVSDDVMLQRKIAFAAGRDALARKILGTQDLLNATVSGIKPSEVYTDPDKTVYVLSEISPEDAASAKSAPVSTPTQVTESLGLPSTTTGSGNLTDLPAPIPDRTGALPDITPATVPSAPASTQDADSLAAADQAAGMVPATAETNVATPQPATAPSPAVNTHNPAYDFFFSENYKQLPKLRLAPDLLVYINKSRILTTWLGDSFDLNDWLTSANGGSGMDRQHMCTLNFYIPRHLEYYFVGLGGRFILRPFYEVEVYAKGRFLVDGTSDLNSEAALYGSTLDSSSPSYPSSRFYRIFWGWVASIVSEWQEGDYSIVVNCAPALRVFELTHLRNNLSVLGPADQLTDINPYASPGIQGNPLEVILNIYSSFVSMATEFNVTNLAVGASADTAFFEAQSGTTSKTTAFGKLANRSMSVWNDRIKSLQKRTTFFGLGYYDPVTGKTNESEAQAAIIAEVKNSVAAEVAKLPPSSFDQTPLKQDLSARTNELSALTDSVGIKKTYLDSLTQQVQGINILLTASRSQGSDPALSQSDIELIQTVIPSITVMSGSDYYFYSTQISDVKSYMDAGPIFLDTLTQALTNLITAPSAELDAINASIVIKQAELAKSQASLDQVAKVTAAASPTDASAKPTTATPSASVVSKAPKNVGPLSIFDIISSNGFSIKNPQDSQTGRFSIFLQDWAIANYVPFFQIGTFDLFTLDENKRRLDVLVEMANVIGYEFYQDLSGNVIFKPPFYNMDTRADAVFNINDIDILSEQISEDESQIQLTNTIVIGSYSPLIQSADRAIQPQTQWIDLRLVSKYGQRSRVINQPMIRGSEHAFVYAVSEMAKANRFATKINIQIPARPELMLGFPIYLQGRDCFGYLERIQWSYTAASDFTFQLELSSIRRRIYIDRKRLAELKAGRLPTTTSTKTSADYPPTAGKTGVAEVKKDAKPTTDTPPADSGKKYYPLARNYTITSAFTEKREIDGKKDTHSGIDLGCGENTAVYAPTSGKIVLPAKLDGGGLSLSIIGTDGSVHVFCHLLECEANGKLVAGGDKVGLSGGGDGTKALLAPQSIKPHSIGAHLHWTVKVGGKPVDPYTWLKIGSSVAEDKVSREKLAAPTGVNYPGASGDARYTGSGSAPGSPAAPKPTEPSIEVANKLSADKNAVSARTGRDITAMVPLPNAVIQIFRDKSKENLGAPTPDPVEVAKQNKDRVKVATGELATATTALATAEKKLKEYDSTLGLASLLQAQRDAQAVVATASVIASSFSPAPAFDLRDSNLASATSDELASLTATKQAYQAARDAWEQMQSAVNEATCDEASKNYLTTYTALSKAVLDRAKQALSTATEALNEKENDDKRNSLQADVDASKRLIESKKLAIESDTKGLDSVTSKVTGNPVTYSKGEVDDILDADPDMQIYAFGVDTFTSAKNNYEATDEQKKSNAQTEKVMNKVDYFRPNIYHPYRIVIDEKFMGPQKASRPSLKSPKDNEAAKTTLGTAMGDSAVAATDAVKQQNAAAIADTLALAGGSQAALANGISDLEKQKNTKLQVIQECQNYLATLQVEPSLKYYADLQVANTGYQALSDYTPETISAFRDTIPSDTYAYYAIQFSEGMYEQAAYTDPNIAEYFAEFLSDATVDAKNLADIVNKSIAQITAEIAQATKALELLDTQMKTSTSYQTRLAGVSSSATARLNALQSNTSGNLSMSTDVSDKYTPEKYMGLLKYQQPYTDSNGFEQLVGFPWGRSVSVTSAAENLRLDATALKFTQMLPQVLSKYDKTQLTKEGTDQPGISTTTPSVSGIPGIIDKGFSVSSLGSMAPGIASSGPSSLPITPLGGSTPSFQVPGLSGFQLPGSLPTLPAMSSAPAPAAPPATPNLANPFYPPVST